MLLLEVSCRGYVNKPRVIRTTVTEFLVAYCRSQSLQKSESGRFSSILHPGSHSAAWNEIKPYYEKVNDIGYVCDLEADREKFSVRCKSNREGGPRLSFFVNETNILRADFDGRADANSPFIFPDPIQTRRMEGR